MNQLKGPARPWMPDLYKQFSSSFSGKLNLLIGPTHQWKAAFWFKQGQMVNMNYHQQEGKTAFFNFIYDFAAALEPPDEKLHPSLALAWVAEPELFLGVACWAWNWADFCAAWAQQKQKAQALALKAPRPEYFLRTVAIPDQKHSSLPPLAQEILAALKTTPKMEDLYALDKWAAGELTQQLVALKQQGLLKAYVARATSPSE